MYLRAPKHTQHAPYAGIVSGDLSKAREFVLDAKVLNASRSWSRARFGGVRMRPLQTSRLLLPPLYVRLILLYYCNYCCTTAAATITTLLLLLLLLLLLMLLLLLLLATATANTANTATATASVLRYHKVYMMPRTSI